MSKKKAFVAATAHLDTVWRWNLAKTIDEFLPDTLEQNIDLIEKYPHYRFNFEGAFRYKLAEEYYPLHFEYIKKLINEGKWCVSGSEYENGDVNIPSPEALFRNILLGNGYFEEKFGKECKDIFLPDCFGFGRQLPSVMKHAGLLGFSTQKLSWGSANGVPFDTGIWKGIDGSEVFACLDAKSYRYKFDGDIRGDISVINKISRNAFEGGLPQTMHLYGTGDWGGAPDEKSVQAVEESVSKNSGSDFEVISAATDDFFKELDALPEAEKAKLPKYDGELLMTSHGAGAYTSRAMNKRLNAQNELLADQTERLCTAAHTAGVLTYPAENLNRAWERVIQHQFHDDITGTGNMDVCVDSQSDYFLSLSEFKTEYCAAAGALANELDTKWVSECAVIVSNAVAHKRKAAVSAHIRMTHNCTFIKVLDQDGNEAPSQIVYKSGKEFDIIFIAEVEAMGLKVYDVVPADSASHISTDLKVSEHVIENEKYQLIFNKNGDIAQIIDKINRIKLLESPIKMACFKDTGALSYPSWEIRKKDIDREPIFYANTPQFEIIESGPARAAIKVTRELDHSTIEQTVYLESGSAYIRVENRVDWRSRRTMLKAVFPFTCYNRYSDYDLGLGVIKRENNTEKLYEVPAQKWADITAGSGKYGVSVFSDCKYGWDKPASNTLRLTCLHTPAGAFTKETRQDLQDLGRNIFSFGIYSHSGGYENGTQYESECFLKPMTAFQTGARRAGELGSSFSFMAVNDRNCVVRAVKLAEDGNGIIVRVNEGTGAGRKGIKLRFYKKIENACETLASEKGTGKAQFAAKTLNFSLKPFEVKTFRIQLEPGEKKPRESFKKLELAGNSKGFTPTEHMRNVILQGGGCSLPAELCPKSITVGGITFRMPDPAADKDVTVARGQSMEMPKGCTKLYLLAASTLGDREVTFYADGKEKPLTIYSFKEPIGKWDMAGLKQTAKIKDAILGYEFTHTHHPEGDIANGKVCFYIYEIDIRNIKTLTLPEDNRVIILAMTAVKKFSNTRLATKITDESPAEDYSFDEIPPIEKIIDRSDFVTIRAGKIQDQKNGGKGKGFKRDNIITNIIRSYTKSEW